MMRYILFAGTNMAVLFVLSIILQLFGVHPTGITQIILMSFVFGMVGSIISLLMSKRSAINGMGVQLIEQPFPTGELTMVAQLSEQFDMAIIADEDCQDPSDIQRLAGCYDGINIKLMKCGGMHNALDMIRQSRKSGLSIMLGCMTESSIGISAAHLLAHLVDYVDLDGNMLIDNDPAIGGHLDEGYLKSIGGNGIQCRLKSGH